MPKRASVTLVGCESYGYRGRIFRKNIPDTVEGELLHHCLAMGSLFAIQWIEDPKPVPVQPITVSRSKTKKPVESILGDDSESADDAVEDFDVEG